LDSLPTDATFICVLEGFLKIDVDAHYIFELGDQGHSKVFVGEILVIGEHFDLDGGESYNLPLRKGFHPLRVAYFHRKGERNLEPIHWKPETQDDSPIPLERLYS
jgi:hypothetical protein